MPRRKKTAGYREAYKACPVQCPMIAEPPASVSEYLAILDSALQAKSGDRWFRGHADLSWRLAPSALRYRTKKQIERALGLLVEFRRHAEFRINRPPPFDDGLKWMQLGQHHGLPTRLLDWTSNAAIALYFACLIQDTDGMVFVMDPTDLNTRVLKGERRLLDPQEDRRLIETYLKLPPIANKRGMKTTIAIQPIVNSERIQLQRGAFTLHGNREFDLTNEQARSLCYIPILARHKEVLLAQLRAIGVDEISIFPEPEHICRHLKRLANL